MKIKSKLLTGSVLFVIISAILALLFTNNYISVKSTSNYINSIGAEVTAGEVYINKTGDTDKISDIQGKGNSYSWLDISIPDDERPEGRGNNASHYIIENSGSSGNLLFINWIYQHFIYKVCNFVNNENF